MFSAACECWDDGWFRASSGFGSSSSNCSSGWLRPSISRRACMPCKSEDTIFAVENRYVDQRRENYWKLSVGNFVLCTSCKTSNSSPGVKLGLLLYWRICSSGWRRTQYLSYTVIICLQSRNDIRNGNKLSIELGNDILPRLTNG